jgi:membrane protein DedA with SNARE-associated domain
MMETVYGLIESYGLLAVFLGCMAEGESAAILGGFFAHQGIFVLWQAYLVAFVGAFIGDNIFFALGRRYSDHHYVLRLRAKPGFAHAYAMLQKHPDVFVLTNRYIYGLRTVGGIAAGFSSISVPRFLLLNGISALVWAGIFCTLGYVFGLGAEHLIGDTVMRHQKILLGLAVAVAVGLAAYMLARLVERRERARSQSDAVRGPDETTL